MTGSPDPLITVVIPAKNESARIGRAISRVFGAVRADCEIVVVVDSSDDPTWTEVHAKASGEPRLRCLVGEYGPGPANAIRYGIDQARADTIVVTMADNSDDPGQIDELAALVQAGAAVAAASRYSPGGSQIGGPLVKGLLSRLAGWSLFVLAKTGTRDATNSFKAYSRAYVRDVGVDSRQGFAIAIELIAKARRLRLPVAEVPTVWLDRHEGHSAFRLLAWLPAYLRWYLFCFGRALTVEQVRARCARADDHPDTVPAPVVYVPAQGGPDDWAAVQRRPEDWAAWHVIAPREGLVSSEGSRGAA